MQTAVYQQRAEEVMSRDVVSVHAQDTIQDALMLMVENRVSALPVVDQNNRCIGIVSSSDLVELTKDLEDEVRSLDEDTPMALWLVKSLVTDRTHEKIVDVMSTDVESVRPETLIPHVAATMLRNRVHRLPVVDNNSHLVGIISTMDIIGAFADSAYG